MLWVDSHLSASKLPSTHLLASEKGFRCDVGSILGFTVIGAHIEWNDGPQRSSIAIVHGVGCPPNAEQGSRTKSVGILRTTPIQSDELRMKTAFDCRGLQPQKFQHSQGTGTMSLPTLPRRSYCKRRNGRENSLNGNL